MTDTFPCQLFRVAGPIELVASACAPRVVIPDLNYLQAAAPRTEIGEEQFLAFFGIAHVSPLLRFRVRFRRHESQHGIVEGGVGEFRRFVFAFRVVRNFTTLQSLEYDFM